MRCGIKKVLLAALVTVACASSNLSAQIVLSMDETVVGQDTLIAVRVTGLKEHPFNAFKFVMVETPQVGHVIDIVTEGSLSDSLIFRPVFRQYPLIQGGNSSSHPLREDGILLYLGLAEDTEPGWRLEITQLEIRNGTQRVPFSPEIPGLDL